MASVTEWAVRGWRSGSAGYPSDWDTTGLDYVNSGYIGTNKNEIVCFRFKFDSYVSQFDLKLCNSGASVNNGYEIDRTLRYKILATDDTAYHNTNADTDYDGTIVTSAYKYSAVTTTITAAGCGFYAFSPNVYYYLFIFGWNYSGTANYQHFRTHAVDTSYGSGIIASSIVEAVVGLVNIDNGSSFDLYTVHIDNGSSWDQYIPYIDTGTAWVQCGG